MVTIANPPTTMDWSNVQPALMLEALADHVHFPIITVGGLDIAAVEMLLAEPERNQHADRHRW